MPRVEESRKKSKRKVDSNSSDDNKKNKKKSSKISKSKTKKYRRSSYTSPSDSDSSHYKKKSKHKKKLKRKKSKDDSGHKDKSKKKMEHLDDDLIAGPSVESSHVEIKGPMTKEMWEKQQNVVRRVFDVDTGRARLVKGSGEIIEEIVSKQQQKQLNKLATQGDGISYSIQTGTLR